MLCMDQHTYLAVISSSKREINLVYEAKNIRITKKELNIIKNHTLSFLSEEFGHCF